MSKTPTPFAKILVANRGEIALRIIRTARRMGYGTVAVHSSADVDALHVAAADQACAIGGGAPAESYLRIDIIVAAALASGADAVHPGYGFLAENADFARACRNAGLVFIGPAPETIELMGDKARAKELMRQSGVPCIPGYQGTDQSNERLAAEAAAIGYPVMIKASAGGGGRGMRLARDATDFVDLLHAARSEAQHAFGDSTLLLERAVEGARHVEIQIFGDRYGNALHLGERDCSVQRRHQKLIEESPSPAVSPGLRARMGDAATSAVQALRYEGAGTLEFLVDAAGDFFFMEMNTRLQVEHPVTEAVTGLDLVELQLRVAAGESLPMRQEDVRFSGHAIEVRLCAEDPEQGFLPRSGTVALWRAPEGLRVEHALATGARIAPFYDSMIAKIIAHGGTREEARRRLVHGLADTTVLGLGTNLGFLRRCLEHPVFVAGAATTAFVDAHRAELRGPPPDTLAGIAALALHVTDGAIGAFRLGRSLASTFPVPLRFDIEGRTVDAVLCRDRDGLFAIEAAGQVIVVELDLVTEDRMRFRVDGVQEAIGYARTGNELHLAWRGGMIHVSDRSRAAAVTSTVGGGDGKLCAAMSGRVAAVLVTAGDAVEAGQPVLVLEAMKMEHVHTAPVAGIVAAIHVGQDEQVAANKIVAEIVASVPGVAQ
jgi:geranyl-CoA carboxylase alpha subunit